MHLSPMLLEITQRTPKFHFRHILRITGLVSDSDLLFTLYRHTNVYVLKHVLQFHTQSHYQDNEWSFLSLILVINQLNAQILVL